jgi:hypothetical protein
MMTTSVYGIVRLPWGFQVLLEVVATCAESGQLPQSLYSYLCCNIFIACWYLSIVCKVLMVIWMVQVTHYSLCRILSIRNKIEVDGVFVSYNIFYTSHSCGLLQSTFLIGLLFIWTLWGFLFKFPKWVHHTSKQQHFSIWVFT